ncbi:MAG TPA: DNA double-strand break repair nuclease NurA, partial [Allocoleopsis sp.]
GVPVESLNTRMPIIEAPYTHTVMATDGSQIAPSHHEIAYCYLINIGRIMIHYGQSKQPLLDSLPEVFYKEEDLYISRQWGIKVEEWLGYIRTTSETKVLAELAQEWVKNEHKFIPSLAMVDGSLIYWFLETLPIEAREKILNPILESWDIFKELNIPIMGYISASRNSDSLNFLRFLTCPHPVPDCHTYCANLQKQPCQIFEPIKDVGLWSNELSPGERSPLWQSKNRILELYHGEKIYFCYVNVGSEIARIEMPGWVAENQQLLNQALSLMLAQVNKGYGYPVALAEAHNLAVIRSSDRAYFFKLLEQEMIKSGLRNVGISYKETRKRGSIA